MGKRKSRLTGKPAKATDPRAVLLMGIFRRMLVAYGPQHWWPADGPFEVMVGAVLTQATAWANVAKAISNLKAANALSAAALRRLSEDDLAALIRPSGYYRGKTRKIKALVAWLDKYGDNLPRAFSMGAAELRGELLAVYGIGEETADSILLYAAGKPAFVIDAYTRRVVNRVGIPIPGRTYKDYQGLFVDNLPGEAALFNEYHALLVQHGKRTCRLTPSCPVCCLRDICRRGLAPANRGLSVVPWLETR
jgi:endonuclease-3 related protein